jgi:ribosome biogenesis GTPase
VLSGGAVYRCAIRGRLETADSEDRALLAVGDQVEFSPLPNNEGVVERMLPRRNVLLRAAPGTRRSASGRSRHPRFRHVIAANVDRVVLVTSVREPDFRPGIVDRFLVAAASQELPASLVVNKTDLASDESARAELESHRALYEGVGVKVALTSAADGTGLEALSELLLSGRCVLVGHSGVGKSTLLNALDPSHKLPVRPVNRKTGKGAHTTSVAALLSLSSGARVVDTPGLRELDIMDVASVDLEAHFPEFLPLLERCEMDNCAHRDEPGCAVKAAVESGEVSGRRYQSYLVIRGELEEGERAHGA